jgi:hypothetical protein
MRLVPICLAAALLAGCASDRISKCSSLAGPGWSTLDRPPPNAAQLLELENLPADRDLVWLAKGQDWLMMCDYARGLTSPGCGGSTAFEFQHKGDRWVSRGQVNYFCETGPS